MERITSITRRVETVRAGRAGILSYRYFVDKDIIWFNLHDICYFFNITSERFINKFYDETLDCNKSKFFDNNKYSKIGNYDETYFVNKIAIQQLEEHQDIRHKTLNIDIDNLEKEEGLVIENDDNNYEFKQLVQNIKVGLNTAEKTTLNNNVYELVHTRQINEIIEKSDYDPGLEEEVQNYRNWLQEKYDPENSLYIMHKGIRNNNVEQVYYEKYVGPSIDEALDILFNAGIEE